MQKPLLINKQRCKLVNIVWLQSMRLALWISPAEKYMFKKFTKGQLNQYDLRLS